MTDRVKITTFNTHLDRGSKNHTQLFAQQQPCVLRCCVPRLHFQPEFSIRRSDVSADTIKTAEMCLSHDNLLSIIFLLGVFASVYYRRSLQCY